MGNRILNMFMCCVLILFSTFCHAQSGVTLPETIRKIKPSIVGIGSYDPLGSPRTELKGTGFAIGGDLVVTNYHVVAPIQAKTGSDLVVLLGTGPEAKGRKADVVASEQAYDLAILKAKGAKLPALRISSRLVAEGELVAFTGFPIGSVLGLYPATHRGIISSVTPVVTPANSANELTPDVIRRLRNPYYIYQLDATAYPGNSGSPVYDPLTGDVLGIINKVFIKKSKEAILSDPSGITYAIPSAFLLEMMKKAR